METVLLADMNSFFASVEQALQPNLKGKPVIVCGDPAKRHGITLAASREAKKFGIKTAMPCHQALNLCPEAIVVRPQMARYVEYSGYIVEIAKLYSPLVEPFSIDEFFVETRGTERLHGSGIEVARRLRKQIAQELDLPCSIGVAENKILAKVCCDVAAKKSEAGLTVWRKSELAEVFWPLPVRCLFGVGARMEKNFYNMGITTIGTLASYPLELLKKRFGIMGEVYHLSANGIDNSPVTPHSHDSVKGIGHSVTLPRDYYLWCEIKVALQEITEEVCRRARRKGKIGRTVSLYVRGIDLRTSVHRSKTITVASNVASAIYPTIEQLFNNFWGQQPVRALQITLSNLQDDSHQQLDLFTDRVAERALAYTVDNIKYRYGKTAIFTAESLLDGALYHERAGLIGGHKA